MTREEFIELIRKIGVDGVVKKFNCSKPYVYKICSQKKINIREIKRGKK